MSEYMMTQPLRRTVSQQVWLFHLMVESGTTQSSFRYPEREKEGKSQSQKSRTENPGNTERLVCTERFHCHNPRPIVSTRVAATSTTEDKGLEIGSAKDDDPDGIKLLTDREPLERAWKLLNPLTTAAKDNIDVWIQVYDVAVRRGM